MDRQMDALGGGARRAVCSFFKNKSACYVEGETALRGSVA